MNVATLVASLSLDTAKFTSGVAVATRETTKVEQAMDKATKSAGATSRGMDGVGTALQQMRAHAATVPGPLGEISSGLDRLGGIAGSVTGTLAGPAGLAIAVVAVGAALVTLAEHMGSTIERLDNLSRQTGLSVAALQTLEQMAKESGEAPAALAMGFAKIGTAMAEVIKGTPNAGAAFKLIGVDLRALVASGASVETVLGVVAKKFSEVDDALVKSAASYDIFGIRSRAMETALAAIAEKGLPALEKEMRAAGIVTTEAANSMARAFDAMSDQANRHLTALGNQLAQQFMPLALAALTMVRMGVEGLITTWSALSKLNTGTGPWGLPDFAGAKKEMDEGVARMKEMLDVTKIMNDIRKQTEAGFKQSQTQTPRDIPDPEGQKRADAIQKAADEIMKQIEAVAAVWRAADSMLNAQNPKLDAYQKVWVKITEETEKLRNTLDPAFVDDIAEKLTTWAEAALAADVRLKELTADNKGAMEAFKAASESLDAFTPTLEAQLPLLQEEERTFRLLGDEMGSIAGQAEEFGIRLGSSVTVPITQYRLLAEEVHKVDANLALLMTQEDEYATRGVVTLGAVAQAHRHVKEEAQSLAQAEADAAAASGTAWEAFAAGFKVAMVALPTAMEGITTAAQSTAAAATTALSAGFFDIMTGNFKNLGDVAEQFLQDLLRIIIKFLAEQAVKELLQLFADWQSSGSSTPSDGGGGGGSIWDWFNFQSGGRVPGGPGGGDRVPALLTGGEFVVNARAAAANGPMLNTINAGGAAVPAGGGGGGGATGGFGRVMAALVALTGALDALGAAAAAASETTRELADHTRDGDGATRGATAATSAAADAARDKAKAETAATAATKDTTRAVDEAGGKFSALGAKIGGMLGGLAFGPLGAIAGTVIGGNWNAILDGLKSLFGFGDAVKGLSFAMDPVTKAAFDLQRELERTLGATRGTTLALDPMQAALDDAAASIKDTTKEGIQPLGEEAATAADRAKEAADKTGKLGMDMGDFGLAIDGLGKDMAEATDAAGAAAGAAGAAADRANDAADRAERADGGEKGSGDGGGHNFAVGGIVRRRTRATVGEAGPEAILPLDARHLAAIGVGIRSASVGLSLPGDAPAGSDPQLHEQTDILREIARLLRRAPIARGDVFA